MGQQIVHRLLISFPALLGVLFLCFCLLQVVPADPGVLLSGPPAQAQTNAARSQAQGMAQEGRSTVRQSEAAGTHRSAAGNGWIERSEVDRRRVERPGIRDRRSGGSSA